MEWVEYTVATFPQYVVLSRLSASGCIHFVDVQPRTDDGHWAVPRQALALWSNTAKFKLPKTKRENTNLKSECTKIRDGSNAMFSHTSLMFVLSGYYYGSSVWILRVYSSTLPCV